jgi:hypothetical protein
MANRFSEEEIKYTREHTIYQCRICFRSDSDKSDPLISPCKCAGSMSYIHYKCLKQCISMKINKKVGDNYICYIWKNFECEICLAEYPKYIKYKHCTYPTVDVEVLFEQYIVLDYTLYDDSKRKSFRKGIIVCKVNDDEEITIGRTQSNTIKLKDISVSRLHCYFIKKEGKVFIADKGSKFGTLLYLNRPFMLSLNPISTDLYSGGVVNLVSGKNHFSMRVISQWSFFGNLFGQALCCRCKAANDEEIIIFEDNEGENALRECNYMNDSYCDYVICLEKIIKNNDCYNNNSFI